MRLKHAASHSAFWKQLMQAASRNVDYGDPLPDLNDRFLSVWAAHYTTIVSLAPPQPPLLEIGAGFGILAAGLGETTKQWICSTEHPTRAYFFKPAYRHFLNQHHTLIIGNDLNDGLPFLSGIFQQVYFCDVIEHLTTDTIGCVLDEIRRVLAANGRLILSTPNLNRFSNLFRFLWSHTVNPPFEVSRHGRTFGHIREFAPKEIECILSRHGFCVMDRAYGLNPYYTAEAFGVEQVFSAGMVKMINRMTALVSRLFPFMADQMFLVAALKN